MTKASAAPRFSLSSIAIRRHIGTLMLTLALIVLGVFITLRTPVDLLPSITYPRIGLRLDAPGISPEVAIDEITRPLEEALSATEGVIQVFSQTREGRVSLDLYFEPGGNIDQALNDATATLNRARGNLPDTVEAPRLFKVDPSQLPVYEMALTSSSLPIENLRVFAEEDLARELARVPGVASVDVSGGVEEEVQVNIDLQRLQATRVTLPDVLNTLTARNQDTSGGRLRGGETEVPTRLVGRFESAEELQNLAIPVADTDPPQQIYLRDVATIEDGTAEQRIFVNLNGTPAVKVSIQKQPDANTVQVVEGLQERLESMRQAGLMPQDMQMTATLDESRFIRNSINNVAMSGLTGAALAAVAVLMFLGSLRQTLIIVLAIPLATLAALMLMGLFGLTLNVFSLGGLALGVGIVVDNSIVMLENITKRIEEADLLEQANYSGSNSHNGSNGHDGHNGSNGHNGGNGHPSGAGRNREILRQAEESSQELESALLASTTTNLVAVLPFLLIGGFVALLFNELILTISFSVAASMVVALTVVPALASRLLMIRSKNSLRNMGPFRWFSQRLEGLTLRYGKILTWILQRRLLIIGAAVLIFGGSSFWMVGQIPQEILPRISNGQANLNAQFPAGTTVEGNRRVMAAVDELLMAQPETEFVFTTAGGSLFGTSTNENTARGSSTIILKPDTNVPAFVERMSAEVSQLPLVDTTLRLNPGSVRGLILSNSPVRADVDVMLQGEDTRALNEAGQQVLAALGQNATLARYRRDGEEPQPEIQIRPDWARVADLSLTSQEIGATIETALNGSVPTQLQRGNRLVDIQVQLAPGSVQRPEQLQQIPIFASGGQLLQLGDLAQVEVGEAPGEIQRINQRQVFLIAGSLAEDASLGDALAEVDDILADLELPEGVTILPSSSGEANQELQRSLGTLGGLAAFLVFVVMAVQYNSLIDPLVIMLTVPLALAGGILGLFLTQTAIGATVIVGAVLLVGIVVNNAIIMVELANQICDRTGCSRTAAILQAAPQRLRPILMTTITTVLGLFPLALGLGEGSEFLQPLGIVVFSGLSLATVLTLFIIPCFYTLLHEPWWNRREPLPPQREPRTNLEEDPAYSRY
ncbi:efflux RND transporter permease subunit [Pseudanabaena sp. FACHB-2040]|uniref:efflux RND transporter permease subunit n=1 Tax=Pseudanabaena sp. FACHB-2040 TaxID=2692859 RepID=UPI0016843DE2|nr:efflux RND transporter permease subunit [Pseudanabaena sp. FACHB-2040]MBD2256703.1 efflux RND transporter permease subunit [Pseudanabaena sp. FACHB-2040]